MKKNRDDILLCETILARQGIEFAVFDEALNLVTASRALQRKSGPANPSLSDVIPELAGMEETIQASLREGEEIVIPRLNRPRGGKTHYVDLHLAPLGGRLLVILKNSTPFGALEQKLTQQRNEMALLNRELEKSYRMLGNLSGLDELTQLSNRNAARHIFQHRLVNAKKYQQPLSLIFLDMDNLKQINDRHGHDSGDCALQFLTKTLRDAVRSDDALARWGGDEFAILLNNEWQGARRIANALLSTLADRSCALPNGNEEKIRVSIGICHVPAHALKTASLEKILQAADRAMYLSKRSGGNRVTEVNLE